MTVSRDLFWYTFKAFAVALTSRYPQWKISIYPQEPHQSLRLFRSRDQTTDHEQVQNRRSDNSVGHATPRDRTGLSPHDHEQILLPRLRGSFLQAASSMAMPIRMPVRTTVECATALLTFSGHSRSRHVKCNVKCRLRSKVKLACAFILAVCGCHLSNLVSVSCPLSCMYSIISSWFEKMTLYLATSKLGNGRHMKIVGVLGM